MVRICYNPIRKFKNKGVRNLKKHTVILASILVCALLCSACGTAPAGKAEQIYRGEIKSVLENGDILVAQLPGHNYGQSEILFHASSAIRSSMEESLPAGAYVTVHYSGALTRSIPPQGTAASVSIVSHSTDGIIQNGVIQSVNGDQTTGYSIAILPIGVAATDSDADMLQQIVLTVPSAALEGLTEAELVEGKSVSAVTMGIATMSLPPQMPVVALLPYTE